MLSDLCRGLDLGNATDIECGFFEEALVCLLAQAVQVLLHLNDDWGTFIVLDEKGILVPFDELFDCLTEDS